MNALTTLLQLLIVTYCYIVTFLFNFKLPHPSRNKGHRLVYSAHNSSDLSTILLLDHISLQSHAEKTVKSWMDFTYKYLTIFQ